MVWKNLKKHIVSYYILGVRYVGYYNLDKFDGLGGLFWPGPRKSYHGIFSNNNKLKGLKN